MTFDSLIFDLDGTLWDSSAACAVGWNTALKGLGVTMRKISKDDIGSIMGLTHQRIFEKIFPEATPEERERIAERCYREELAAIRASRVGVYPGVVEGLPRLAARYKLFVVSNCLTDYLDLFWETSGLMPLFRDAVCHGATGKTKAENIRLVVEKHGLASPAYIGDTASDQRAALAAGVPYFHVSYGFGDPEQDCLEFTFFDDVVAFFSKD